jgi:hypothetical protein
VNEELRGIVEPVEQLDSIVQKAIVKEFQRVVKVVAEMAPRDLMPWNEEFERFTLRARTVLQLAKGAGDLGRAREKVEAITGCGDHAVDGVPLWTMRARQVFALAKEEARRLKAGPIGTDHVGGRSRRGS